jgi:hypothetical protein
VSMGQGRSYEACRIATTSEYSCLEMGRHQHGFHCGSVSLSAHKFDSIWVIVDRFTKTAHFIQVHTNYRVEKYVELYIARILCPHGVLKTIISDRGPQVVNCF